MRMASRDPADQITYPSVAAFKQLLSEAPNTMVGDMVGYDVASIPRIRQQLNVPDPWLGTSRVVKAAARKVLSFRWCGYPDEIPPPVEWAVIERMVQAELGILPPAPVRVPPITVGAITLAVRAYHKERDRWPSGNELEAHIGEAAGFRSALRLAQHHGMLDVTGGQVRPREIAQANAVTTSRMTAEDIAKYGPPRNSIEAERIKDFIGGLVSQGGSTQGVDPERATRDAERAAANHTYAPGSPGRYKEVGLGGQEARVSDR